MNKKGQVIVYGVMLFVIAFITAVLVLPPMLDASDTARSDMGCDLDNKTQGVYLCCIGVDLFPFFFFGAILAAAAALITKSGGG